MRPKSLCGVFKLLNRMTSRRCRVARVPERRAKVRRPAEQKQIRTLPLSQTPLIFSSFRPFFLAAAVRQIRVRPFRQPLGKGAVQGNCAEKCPFYQQERIGDPVLLNASERSAEALGYRDFPGLPTGVGESHWHRLDPVAVHRSSTSPNSGKDPSMTTATISNKEVQKTLRSVIQSLIDGQEGFQQIGEKLDDPTLRR